MMMRLLLVALTAIILMSCSNISSHEKDPTSVVGELRGDTLIFIRQFEGDTPPVQIALIGDGTVFRSTFVARRPPTHPYRIQEIDAQDWEAANAVRLDWCDDPPQFAEPAAGEEWYVVGINCNPLSIWQVEVPADQFPDSWKRLWEIVPPPVRGNN